jgi:SAM-dependent methyltransferase
MDVAPAISSPLSGSANVTFVATLPVSTIVSAYRRRLGIEVAAYFDSVSELTLLQDNDSGLMFFYPPTPGPEALYADLSTRFDWYHPRSKQEFDIARRYIAATDDVLEVGAGPGFFCAGTVCKSYTGLELNKSAVQAARQRGLELQTIDATVLARDRPASFDVVCSFQVVEHVADPRSFIAAMVALTRPGGRIILSTPSADGFIRQSRNVLNVPPHHITWWPDKTWYWIREAFDLRSVFLHANSPREQLFDCIPFWMNRRNFSVWNGSPSRARKSSRPASRWIRNCRRAGTQSSRSSRNNRSACRAAGAMA